VCVRRRRRPHKLSSVGTFRKPITVRGRASKYHIWKLGNGVYIIIIITT